MVDKPKETKSAKKLTPDEFSDIWLEEHEKWIKGEGKGLAAICARTSSTPRSASMRASKYRKRKPPIKLPRFTGGRRGPRHDWTKTAARVNNATKSEDGSKNGGRRIGGGKSIVRKTSKAETERKR